MLLMFLASRTLTDDDFTYAVGHFGDFLNKERAAKVPLKFRSTDHTQAIDGVYATMFQIDVPQKIIGVCTLLNMGERLSTEQWALGVKKHLLGMLSFTGVEDTNQPEIMETGNFRYVYECELSAYKTLEKIFGDYDAPTLH